MLVEKVPNSCLNFWRLSIVIMNSCEERALVLSVIAVAVKKI